jgi:hypothetical protein
MRLLGFEGGEMPGVACGDEAEMQQGFLVSETKRLRRASFSAMGWLALSKQLMRDSAWPE